MIKGYCNYGIYNDNTGQRLESGDYVDRITCWNDGKKVSLENVRIVRITRDEVTCELEDYEDYEAVVIPIEDIYDWD